jgi:hypothetical protein
MMDAFVPLLVLAGLSVFKVILFKVKSIYTSIAVLGSLVAIVFTFETHFDKDRFNAPLFTVALPFAVILLAVFIKTLF